MRAVVAIYAHCRQESDGIRKRDAECQFSKQCSIRIAIESNENKFLSKSVHNKLDQRNKSCKELRLVDHDNIKWMQELVCECI